MQVESPFSSLLEEMPREWCYAGKMLLDVLEKKSHLRHLHLPEWVIGKKNATEKERYQVIWDGLYRLGKFMSTMPKLRSLHIKRYNSGTNTAEHVDILPGRFPAHRYQGDAKDMLDHLWEDNDADPTRCHELKMWLRRLLPDRMKIWYHRNPFIKTSLILKDAASRVYSHMTTGCTVAARRAPWAFSRFWVAFTLHWAFFYCYEMKVIVQACNSGRFVGSTTVGNFVLIHMIVAQWQRELNRAIPGEIRVATQD